MSRTKIEVLKDWLQALELLDEAGPAERPALEARERELAAEAAALIAREKVVQQC